MRQTRKGRNWYFGLKLHIGVDGVLVWVHGYELWVWGDTWHQDIQQRPEHLDKGGRTTSVTGALRNIGHKCQCPTLKEIEPAD